MTKETLMTQQTIDHFTASDSIGRANSNYPKVEKSAAFTRGRLSLDRSVWYSGQLMTFLATAEDTQGKFALIEAVARRGNDPPPHIHHREEEAFYVLEGEMTFSVGGQTIKATPGTMVCLPREAAHSFVIDSEQVRMLILLTPAGFEGWVQGIRRAGAGHDVAATCRSSLQRYTTNAGGRPTIRHRVCDARELATDLATGRGAYVTTAR